MSEHEKNPAESLRERFRNELRKPVSERYFPEEDLVNVFDTAGDDFDDYIRIEALILGGRLYPDSLALLERRAIFYLDNDQQQFVSFMEDHPDAVSTMFDILRLNMHAGKSHTEIENAVDELMKTIEFREDEEVIQFVQTLHSLGLDKWLVRNLGNLRTRVPYLPTLLYEYAYQAEDSEDLASVAIGVLEELTELEAYVADYWTMLALAYLRENRMEDAASAIDYALAIDPENFHALKTRLHLANLSNDTKSVAETAMKLLEEFPTDKETAALAVLAEQNPEKARLLIQSLDPDARGSRTVVMRAISLGVSPISELLENVYESGITEHEEWLGFADFAYECANLEAINEVMRIYEEKSGNSLNHDYLLMRVMFDLGNYATVATIFTGSEAGGTLRLPENLYTSYSIFLVALLRMGDFDNARSAATSMLEMLENEGGMPGNDLERQAMRDHLSDILKRLNSKKTTDWDKFKPVGG